MSTPPSSRPRLTGGTLAWAGVAIVAGAALLAGCGSSSSTGTTEAPAATTAARDASGASGASVTCGDQSPSREKWVAFHNLLSVPVVLTNTLDPGDCNGWSGPGNPSALDGVTIAPGQSTDARRFEVAGSCLTPANAKWSMTFALGNGDEILSTRTKYNPCREEYDWNYGFYYWQGGAWDWAVHTFTPATQGASDALEGRQVALLGDMRSSSRSNPDRLYIMFDKPKAGGGS